VVRQLLEGDLYDLIHKQKVKLSLFQKMKLAKDAALGMNWLHHSNPRIIHRGTTARTRHRTRTTARHHTHTLTTSWQTARSQAGKSADLPARRRVSGETVRCTVLLRPQA
jgi:hypothetical protein